MLACVCIELKLVITWVSETNEESKSKLESSKESSLRAKLKILHGNPVSSVLCNILAWEIAQMQTLHLLDSTFTFLFFTGFFANA